MTVFHTCDPTRFPYCGPPYGDLEGGPCPACRREEEAVEAIHEGKMVALPLDVAKMLVQGFDLAGDGGIDPFDACQRASVEPWIAPIREERL